MRSARTQGMRSHQRVEVDHQVVQDQTDPEGTNISYLQYLTEGHQGPRAGQEGPQHFQMLMHGECQGSMGCLVQYQFVPLGILPRGRNT